MRARELLAWPAMSAGDDDTVPKPAATVPTARRGAPPSHDLTGRTILHFQIVERLGQGGMGVVYRAFDRKLRRDVALKVLGTRYSADDRNKELIFREARSAAAATDPTIAAIYDVHDVDGIAFIAMELVDGESLRARLARGPLPRPEALRVAREISRGLAKAHALGVVHRDLKPDNIMLTRDGQVKLLDFGLAKSALESEPVVATPGVPDVHGAPVPASSGTRDRVMGTPAYMSPEQARGDRVDARTDIFAFGVVMYEMLVGASPFAHRSSAPHEWTRESGDWTPRPPLRTGRRASDALVARCLELEPASRYRDGAALVRALAVVPRRRRWPWLVLVLAAAAVIVAAILRRGDDAPAPAPQLAEPRVLFDARATRSAVLVGDGKLAAVTDGRLVVSSLSGGSPATFDAPGDGAFVIGSTASPNAVVAITATTGACRAWWFDVTSGAHHELARDPDCSGAVDASPDGQRVVVARDRELVVRDLAGHVVWRSTRSARVTSLQWSPDGTQIELESADRVWIVDASTGRDVSPPLRVLSFAWVGPRRGVAILESSMLRAQLARVDVGAPLPLHALGEVIGRVDAISSDGRGIALLRSDGTSRAYATALGTPAVDLDTSSPLDTAGTADFGVAGWTSDGAVVSLALVGDDRAIVKTVPGSRGVVLTAHPGQSAIYGLIGSKVVFGNYHDGMCEPRIYDLDTGVDRLLWSEPCAREITCSTDHCTMSYAGETHALDLATGAIGGTAPRASSDVTRDGITARAVDLALELRGATVERVRPTPPIDIWTAAAWTDDGVLAVAHDRATDRQHVIVVRRDGTWRDLASSHAMQLEFPQLSPDGSRLAVTGRVTVSTWVYVPLPP